MTSLSDAAAIAADRSIGPQFQSKFDFTLLFEDVFLTILPSAILVIACPFYFFQNFQKAVVADAGWLLWAKLVRASVTTVHRVCDWLTVIS